MTVTIPISSAEIFLAKLEISCVHPCNKKLHVQGNSRIISLVSVNNISFKILYSYIQIEG